MRITQIAINNFLGLTHFRADLCDPILLVAGPNASGKTSFGDALRYALLGDPGRLAYKRDYARLVSDGAKRGSIALTVDGVALTRDVGTGSADPMPPALMPGASICLGAQSFAALALTERRRLLLDLMGVSIKCDDIAQRLIEAGHAADLVERIKPLLRNGFEAASTEAAARARDSKALWRQVTGEQWGSDKGARRPCIVQPVDTARREALLAQAAIIDAEIDKHAECLGAAKAQDEQRARVRELTVEAGRVDEYRSELALAESEQARCLKELGELPISPPRGAMFDCPECGARLAYTRGTVSRCDRAAEGAVPTHYEAQRAALNVERDVLAKRIASLLTGIERAGSASTILASLAGDDNDGSDQVEIAHRMSVLKTERARLAAEMAELEKELAATDLANQREAEAARLHGEVIGWLALADMLSPAGLPASLLAAALGPLQDRLALHRERLGDVRIDADMETYFRGRCYGLCSESERWRIDAALAEAISYLGGTRLFVLDRFDVLEPSARGTVITWLKSVAGMHDTIVMLATLKAEPQIDGVQVAWLGSTAAT